MSFEEWNTMKTDRDYTLQASFAILCIVPMGLRVLADGILRGVQKAGHAILAAIGDENCTVDVPGGSLVKSPSASDFSEAPHLGVLI